MIAPAPTPQPSASSRSENAAILALCASLAAASPLRPLGVHVILEAVCRLHRVPLEELLSPARTHMVTACRRDCVIAIKTLRPFMSSTEIAAACHLRAHSHVLHILAQHFASVAPGSTSRPTLPRLSAIKPATIAPHTMHPGLEALIDRLGTAAWPERPRPQAIVEAVRELHQMPRDTAMFNQRSRGVIAFRYDAAIAVKRLVWHLSQRDIADRVGYSAHHRIGELVRGFGLKQWRPAEVPAQPGEVPAPR